MNVAVIPARGGSKRIPGKNIRPFLGQPLIEYSIAAAQAAGLFHEIIVTTDSEEIAAVARRAGASVPMLRPTELSDDHTATAPVVAHALQHMTAPGATYQYACCILATAPFLRPQDLREGYETIQRERSAVALSVSTFDYPILRALSIDDHGRVRWIWPEHELTRSNDLPEAVHDAGQFYWLDVPRFLTTGRLIGDDAVAVRLPREVVQDIDTLEDWVAAEHKYRVLASTK